AILVITDGADSTFYPQPGLDDVDAELRKYSPTGDMAGYLKKRFGADNDILINVVGFEVNADERKQQKEFKDAVAGIGGSYYDADNYRQLVAYLDRALHQMRFRVEQDVAGEPPGRAARDAHDVSPPGENLRWVGPLDPGTYRVRAFSSSALGQRVR